VSDLPQSEKSLSHYHEPVVDITVDAASEQVTISGR